MTIVAMLLIGVLLGLILISLHLKELIKVSNEEKDVLMGIFLTVVNEKEDKGE